MKHATDVDQADNSTLNTSSPETTVEDMAPESHLTDDLVELENISQIQIIQLEKQVSELKDLYVRAQAEVANVQKRSADEVKKAREYAISNFAKDIVVVQDYLEMALKDQSGNFEAIKTGVDLTLKQLIQVFERNMIKAINPQPNDKLDPHLHQAVSTVAAEGQAANTIVAVMQKGYQLSDRILRPAMVTVAQ